MLLKFRPVGKGFICSALLSSLLLAGCEDSVVEALKIPVATLGAPVFTAPSTELSSAGSVTLALTLSQAVSTTLVAVTGTSAAPQAGLTVVTAGGVSCTSIATTSPSTAGATITVSGCTGNGTVTINASAGIATSETDRTNVASNSRTIVVNNTAPTATLASAVYNPSSPADPTSVVTLTLTYANAMSTSIVTGSGARTTGMTPGLTFSTVSGTADCAVAITSAAANRVDIELTDCQGSGSGTGTSTIGVKVNAGTATGASGLLNAASNIQNVVVSN